MNYTEVFNECPANLTARLATWSNYKHQNTLKFLVASSPFGAVIFVCQAYGGYGMDVEHQIKSQHKNLLFEPD